jgi:hypothetical protein
MLLVTKNGKEMAPKRPIRRVFQERRLKQNQKRWNGQNAEEEEASVF